MLQIISYGSTDSISSLLLTDKKYVTIQNLHSENQSWARVFLITNRVLAYPIIVEGFLSKMFEMTAEYSDGHPGIRPNIRSFLISGRRQSYPVSYRRPAIKRADYLAGYSMLLLAAETQYFWYAIPGKKFEIPGKMFEISGKKF